MFTPPQQRPDAQRTRRLKLKTQAELAEFFGVNRSTIRDWTIAGMPGRPGCYDLGAIIRWLFTFGPWRSEQARDDILTGTFTPQEGEERDHEDPQN